MRRPVIALALLAVTVSLAALPAQAPDFLTLYGYVYDSDGTLVLDSSGCASVDCHQTVTVKVTVGKETRDYNTTILDGSIYTITLGSGAWAEGGTYEIWVDGRVWGDVYYRASNINATGSVPVTKFTFPSGTAYLGSVRMDLRTAGEGPPTVSELANIKPILASLFAVVLLVTGFLFLIYLPRQTVAVEFTGKSKVMETPTKGEQVTFHKYHCAYATASGTVAIGEIAHSEEDVELFQTREVSVSRVLRNPDGTFTWFDPKVLPLKDKAKQLREAVPGEGMKVHTLEGRLLETMDVAGLEALWRAGGKVSLHTQQEPKQAVMQKKRDLFLIFALPFALTEFVIGGVSAVTGLLAVPATTEGWVVNIAIVGVGVFAHILLFMMPRRAKEGAKEVPVSPPPSAPVQEPVPDAGAPPMDFPPPEELPPPDQSPPPPGNLPPP